MKKQQRKKYDHERYLAKKKFIEDNKNLSKETRELFDEALINHEDIEDEERIKYNTRVITILLILTLLIVDTIFLWSFLK